MNLGCEGELRLLYCMYVYVTVLHVCVLVEIGVCTSMFESRDAHQEAFWGKKINIS